MTSVLLSDTYKNPLHTKLKFIQNRQTVNYELMQHFDTSTWTKPTDPVFSEGYLVDLAQKTRNSDPSYADSLFTETCVNGADDPQKYILFFKRVQ